MIKVAFRGRFAVRAADASPPGRLFQEASPHSFKSFATRLMACQLTTQQPIAAAFCNSKLQFTGFSPSFKLQPPPPPALSLLFLLLLLFPKTTVATRRRHSNHNSSERPTAIRVTEDTTARQFTNGKHLGHGQWPTLSAGRHGRGQGSRLRTAPIWSGGGDDGGGGAGPSGTHCTGAINTEVPPAGPTPA